MTLNRIVVARALLGGLCLLSALPTAAAKDKDDLKTSDLFRLTNIWEVHLKLSPESWEAMEPKGGNGFFGGPPRGDQPGRPPGPGPGPGMNRFGPPGGFGPSMLIAPAFLRDGDTDADGKLSRDEFNQLGRKWFSAWDKSSRGQVNEEALREGLNSTLMPVRPGGPGGPGFRMNLQGQEGKRNGVAAAAGIEFQYVKGDLEFDDHSFTNIAVRYKGNGTLMASRDSEKKSLKLDLNDYVKGQKLAGLTKLNLHNNVTDASWMNEVLSHKLFRDGGVPAPRTAYARVYVTVPGQYNREYFGLYSLVENVDDHFAKDNFDSKKGAIFKPVTPDLFAYLGEDWSRYNQTYDPKDDVSKEQKQRVIDLSKLVSQAEDREFNARIAEFIDLDEFARYMAVLVFLADLDGILGPGQNFYLHLDAKSHRFAFIPWDLDHSFGQFEMRGTQEQRENLSIDHPWQGENRFLERMFQHEPFKKLYRAHLLQFSNSIFKPERLRQQVDDVAAAIRPAVAAESADKLARFDAVVAGKSVEPSMFGGPGRGGPRGPGGPGGPPMGGFMPAIKPIKPFVIIRAQSIADQLAGKPGLEPSGFGFGPPGGRPGRGPGPGPGGPGGGPGPGFGPGMFLAPPFMQALDANHDSEITRQEAADTFARWFQSWNKSQSGALTDEELRAGIDRDLAPSFPPFGGPGGGPGGSPQPPR